MRVMVENKLARCYGSQCSQHNSQTHQYQPYNEMDRHVVWEVVKDAQDERCEWYKEACDADEDSPSDTAIPLIRIGYSTNEPNERQQLSTNNT